MARLPRPLSQLSLGIAIALTTLVGSPSQANSLLGAYINGDGWKPENIVNFEATTTKPLAVVNVFSGFSMYWNTHLHTQTSNIVAQGSMPMVTWMPVDSTRKTTNVLPEILAGRWDGYIDTWIAGFKAWRDRYPLDKRPTILLRFAHEFNGKWYPWGNDPTNLKAAWRYVHARFQAAGVNGNIEWVWCANNVNVDNYNDITRYYPGDDVVDWTGLDGYNWGSNYSFTRWKSFDATFSLPYAKLVTTYPTKPIILAEVASAEPHDVPNPAKGQTGTDADAGESKALWVQDMYERIRLAYPSIRAVTWFNTNKELSWALNEPINTGLDAYNKVASHAHYLGSFMPLKTTTTVAQRGGHKKPPLLNVQSIIPSYPDKIPAIVGERLLAQEAEGFRNLPPNAWEHLRKSRLQGM